jgi:predicted nucleic acid-binding protein
MLVVDASVLVPLLVSEDDSPTARVLVEGEPELIAPDLILAEALNVLWKKQRLGQIDDSARSDAVALIGPPLVRLVAMPPLARQASALAQALDHPVYDCFYLVLAEREGVPLVTADRRLIAKAGSAGRDALVRPLRSFAPHG